MARLDMRVAIGKFLKRIAEFRLSQSKEARLKPNGDARGLTLLPLEFSPNQGKAHLNLHILLRPVRLHSEA